MRFCRRDQVHSSRPDPTTANGRHRRWCRTFLRATAAAVETVNLEGRTFSLHTHSHQPHTVWIPSNGSFLNVHKTHVPKNKQKKKIQFQTSGTKPFLKSHSPRGDRSRPTRQAKRARQRARLFYSIVTWGLLGPNNGVKLQRPLRSSKLEKSTNVFIFGFGVVVVVWAARGRTTPRGHSVFWYCFLFWPSD